MSDQVFTLSSRKKAFNVDEFEIFYICNDVINMEKKHAEGI